MTHPEIEAEQAHIDRAHLLLDQARDRARKLRGMVEVSRGGTTQARYERDVIEGSIKHSNTNGNNSSDHSNSRGTAAAETATTVTAPEAATAHSGPNQANTIPGRQGSYYQKFSI